MAECGRTWHSEVARYEVRLDPSDEKGCIVVCNLAWELRLEKKKFGLLLGYKNKFLQFFSSKDNILRKVRMRLSGEPNMKNSLISNSNLLEKL